MLKNISTFVATSLLIQVIIFSDFTSSTLYNCNPNKDCESGYKGKKVRDPKDCHSYYIRLTDSQRNYFPSDNPLRCPGGYYFSSSSCYLGSCENQCSVNLCQAECTSYNYEKVADIKDCSSFYICSPGRIKTHHKCPSTTPYFDGSDCSKDKYNCCTCCDECSSYCEDTYIEVADPYDCRSYYLCLTAGFPLSENRYTCNKGQYFDASLGRCEPESEWNRCEPTCKEKNNNSSAINY